MWISVFSIIIFHSHKVQKLVKGGGNVTRKQKDSVNDQTVLEFYNLASGKLLTGLEVRNTFDDPLLLLDKKYNLYIEHSIYNKLGFCVSFL